MQMQTRLSKVLERRGKLAANVVGTLRSQKYSDIVKSREKFTDELFPPEESSLYSVKTDVKGFDVPDAPKFLTQEDQEKFLSQFALKGKGSDEYVWKRLSEVYRPGEINVLVDPPDLKRDPDALCEDVVQGKLGDCYFLSAISALAENPQRIRNLIPNANFSAAGVFEVLVYVHGEPVKVVVDDYFPFTEQFGEYELAFGGFNQETKNIWPILLEKVWAKVNTSYEDIIAGNSGEAFEFLSPAPIDTFYHEVHKDTLYEEIKDADEKDYIICSDIVENGDSESMNYLTKMGLITNHAYTVIDVREVHDRQQRTIRLLKIRNPWGTNEWLGDWSDKSPLWTADLKKQVQWEDKDDGTYWICYEDFLKFYSSTHICRIRDKYNFFVNKYYVDISKQYNMVSVDVPKDTSGTFIVNLKNMRIYRNMKGDENFENFYCAVTVFRLEGNEPIHIGSTCGRDNRLYVECEAMKKGKYVIAVSFPEKSGHVTNMEDVQKQQRTKLEGMSYRVGIYGLFDKSLQITTVPEKDYGSFSHLMNDLIAAIAKESPNIYYFADEGEKDSWRAISFEQDAGTYGYIYYENNSDGFIHEHITFSQFYNVNLIPLPEKGELTKLNTEEEILEDPDTRESIRIMKPNVDLESSVKVINSVPPDEEVTADNPIEIMIVVAPHSTCTILVEKVDEDAGIELSSRIAITYPSVVLLGEKKFTPKKTRLNYNKKQVEIYECATEHTSGVLYAYKNKTNDLKATVHLTFPEMKNLQIALKSEDLVDSKGKAESKAMEYNIKNPAREVVLSIGPGETKFFELKAVDVFDAFSYSCNLDYQINLSRGQR